MSVYFHGKDGNVVWDTTGTNVVIEQIQNWSCDVNVDTVEVTGMQGEWKSYVSGIKDWTATVDCLASTTGLQLSASGDAATDGLGENTPAWLELYLKYDSTTTQYMGLYGHAICNSIAETDPVDGPVTVTYSFQGSGSGLTWYSDTSAFNT